MTFLPEAIRLFEEFDDELNGFEVGESLPCGLYRCGGGMDGVTGNFGCFYSRVPCGGKRFCVVCAARLQTETT